MVEAALGRRVPDERRGPAGLSSGQPGVSAGASQGPGILPDARLRGGPGGTLQDERRWQGSRLRPADPARRAAAPRHHRGTWPVCNGGAGRGHTQEKRLWAAMTVAGRLLLSAALACLGGCNARSPAPAGTTHRSDVVPALWRVYHDALAGAKYVDL